MDQPNFDFKPDQARPAAGSGIRNKNRKRQVRTNRQKSWLLIGLAVLLVTATVFIAAYQQSDLFAATMNRWMPTRLKKMISAGSVENSDRATGLTNQQTAHGIFKDGKLIVVLDAGHGGSDPGAMATGSDGKTHQEAQLTLQLGKLVASRLEKLGVHVVMTREDDTWVSLYSRIAQASLLSLDWLSARKTNVIPSANRLAALQEALQIPIRINSDSKDSGGLGFMGGYGVGDLQKSMMDLQKSCDPLLFVSIHGNSSTNQGLHGTQVYYCDDEIVALEESKQLAVQASPTGNRAYRNRNSERNRLLATQVYQAIVKELPELSGTNAGKTVLSGNYAVLREQALTSVLIETGFMSHANDLSILLDDDSQQRLANAIAQGIYNFAKARRIGNLD